MKCLLRYQAILAAVFVLFAMSFSTEIQGTRSDVFAVAGADFDVSATPYKMTVNSGDDTFYTVVVKFCGDFKGPVELSVSGLPTGVTAKFDKNPVSATGGSGNAQTKLRISTKKDTPQGHYYLSITGRSDNNGTSGTRVKLIVNSVAGFYLSADPISVSIDPGDTATYEITGNFDKGFNDKVKLTVSGVPAGATAEITPSVIHPQGNKAKLIVKTKTTIKDGNYKITVSGKGESTGVESKVTVNLAVNVLPDVRPGKLTVSKSPHPSKSKVGGIISYTVRIANTGSGDILDVIIRDTLPNGFGYVAGSTVLSGKKYSDPRGKKTITWNIGELSSGSSIVLKYKVVIKQNVKRGKNTNRIKVSGRDRRGMNVSATAKADVSISWDSISKNGKVKGRVYYDKNKNGIKNVDEEGVSGVTIIMERGTKVVTGEDGAFLFEEVREGDHLVALDERKIPKNYFLTSDASKIVSVFWGGTARASFALGYTPPPPKVKPVDIEKEKKKRKAEELAKKKKERLEKLKKEKEDLLKSGRVSGFVFIDTNDNGKYDQGEKRVEGIIVLLDGYRNSKSNKGGKYTFEKVKEGRHTVSVKETKIFKKKYKTSVDKKKVLVKRKYNHRVDIPITKAGGLRVEIDLSIE